jgi:HTH-type transcriptional regulator/antitoxin HigA
LRTEADYDAALAAIEPLFEKEPEPGSPDADEFELLLLVIGDYERRHWPIEPPDPVDAIRYRMERAVSRKPISGACSAPASARPISSIASVR